MSTVNVDSFYTLVLRQSREYWVALCLENGIVGQGATQEIAIDNLQIAALPLVWGHRIKFRYRYILPYFSIWIFT